MGFRTAATNNAVQKTAPPRPGSGEGAMTAEESVLPLVEIGKFGHQGQGIIACMNVIKLVPMPASHKPCEGLGQVDCEKDGQCC